MEGSSGWTGHAPERIPHTPATTDPVTPICRRTEQEMTSERSEPIPLVASYHHDGCGGDGGGGVSGGGSDGGAEGIFWKRH